MLPSVIRAFLRMEALECRHLFTGWCHRAMRRRGGCEQDPDFRPLFTAIGHGDAYEQGWCEQYFAQIRLWLSDNRLDMNLDCHSRSVANSTCLLLLCLMIDIKTTPDQVILLGASLHIKILVSLRNLVGDLPFSAQNLSLRGEFGLLKS